MMKRNRIVLKVKKCLFVVAVIIWIVCAFLIYLLLLNRAQNHDSLTEQTSNKIHRAEYYDILDQIQFQPEIINEEYTVWENLLRDYLHFSQYEKWTSQEISKEQLRKNYLSDICENGNSTQIDFEDIKEMINLFDGTSLLPATDRSFAEILEDLPSMEESYNANPAIFVEEFLYRTLYCISTETPSYENIYQAARAADNALKSFLNSQKITIKQRLLLAAMAVGLYQISLDNLETELACFNAEYQVTGMLDSKSVDEISAIIERYSFTEYKIAEIYIYLFEHNDNSLNKECYNIHFLLSAEAHLKNAQKIYNHEKTNMLFFSAVGEQENKDIHKKQTYHNFYIAQTQYRLIVIYGYDYENMEAECKKYAVNYMGNPYARDNIIESCRYIISMIDDMKEK
ncbi:MAG: hypothetical protein K2J60_15485 [Acetatifactor sp.]|nr:hypothetical protein [Acetatifactor sp.]